MTNSFVTKTRDEDPRKINKKNNWKEAIRKRTTKERSH